MATLAEIEEAISRRISSFILDNSGSAPAPVFDYAVYSGKIERITAAKYRIHVNIDVTLVVKDTESEVARRKGLYPFLEAVILSLLDRDLGLDITPIQPGSFQNTTSQEYKDAGLIAYTLRTSTSYVMAVVSEEDIRNLMTIALSYLLAERADTTVDASDTVNLPLLPKGITNA